MPPFVCSNNDDHIEILNVKNSDKKSYRSQEFNYKSMADNGHDIAPHENDILMGRGGKNNQHIGNEKLRALARLQSENYRVASKKGKSYISRQLVKEVRQLNPPGRFLKKDHATGVWEDVGDDVAREKASQVLRDAVSFSTLSPVNRNLEPQHQCTRSPEEIFSSGRRVASAPPMVKVASRRRRWDEMDYSTPPHYNHQPNMVTPSFYNIPTSFSVYDRSAKRSRYNANTRNEQFTSNSYRTSTQGRYSCQAEYRRSLPTSPIVNSRPTPDKQVSKTNSSLDEFDLFNGELLESDGEGAGKGSKLVRGRIE